MEELADKLELRLKFSAEQAVDTLADYLGFLRMVSIPKLLDAVPRDPDDNMVLECAIEGKAQYIVTGDKDLLVLKVFRDIPNSPRQRLPKTFYEDSIRGHNTAWIMHLHYHVGQDFLAEQLGIAL
jgi:predicted nucleic acid-binding protein